MKRDPKYMDRYSWGEWHNTTENTILNSTGMILFLNNTLA